MVLNENYRDFTPIHEDNSTQVFRAIRISDDQNVIIKVLKSSHRDLDKTAQFINEEKILTTLNSSNIPKLLDSFSNLSEYFHVTEDIGADSLDNIMLKHRFTIKESLDIALSLIETLDYIHKNKIIHADLNPKNIVYNKKTKELQIIDFGLSIQEKIIFLDHEKTPHSSHSLFYISPEQTTLTEEIVDFRSDIYSFGMCIYHMLSGKVPFESDNRNETVHKQIAIVPKPLHSLDKNIPKVLSDIVDKIISKLPTQRYQTDEAIIYDIKRCVETLDKSNKIKDFTIASTDKKSIHVGEKLYGRNRELTLLRQSVNKILANEPTRTVIYGASGVGKTRLSDEFLSYLYASSTNIIRGKLDQYKMYVPYMGYKHLFTQLGLLLSNKEFINIENKLTKKSEDILSFVFPELKLIFNNRESRAQPNTQETSSQLVFATDKLFQAVATKDHPLIIFLDDLQWIDQASSTLIQKTIVNSNNPYLHFIASYRDDMSNSSSAFSDVLLAFESDNIKPLLNLELRDLKKEDAIEMVGDLLDNKSLESEELASIIHKKTGGNPLYMKTFIEFLLDNNELEFKNARWHYSLEKIKTYNTTVNIAQIINSNFSKLTNEEQTYLQYLAILGNHFDLGICLNIMNHYGHPNYVITNIIKNGFIELHGNRYQFSHDNIQKHVFSNMDEDAIRKIHLNIGLYLENSYKKNTYNDIISVVTNLNRAYPPNKIPKKLFSLNIKAIEKMLSNNSYTIALNKIEWVEKNIFNENLWKESRNKTFYYSLLKCRTFYQNSQLERAYKEVLSLIDRANKTEEKLTCFSLLKDICVTQGKNFKELITFGNTLFNELGLSTHAKAELKTSVKNLNSIITNHKLFEKPNDLVHLKNSNNTKINRISKLLVEFWEAAYYLADIDLMHWSYLNIINISFRYGNSSESTFGYVLYGAQLVSQGNYKKAQLFGQVALKLNTTLHDDKMIPKIHNFVANFINPYTKPLSTNVPLYQKSLAQSKINGDIVFGTWANFLMHFSSYLSGESLENVHVNITNEKDLILRSGDTKMIHIFNILHNSIDTLQNGDEEKLKNEEEAIKIWEKDNFYPALAWYAIIKAQNCFLNNEITSGLTYLSDHVHSIESEVIMFPKIRLHFIRALLLMDDKNKLSDNQLELLNSDLNEFDNYYNTSPKSFKFQKLLLDVENEKNEKTTWDVAKDYDRAISKAKELKNNFYLSISNLCAARFWSRLGYEDMKKLYHNESITALNEWGAYSIAKKIKSDIEDRTNYISDKEISLKSLNSNYQSLLNSYSAISKSTSNSELINTLMQIILQNSVASIGVLILKENNSFKVKAVMDYSENTIEFLNDELQNQEYLPNEIINHSIKTKENLILQYPSESGNFQYDRYIKEKTPASITSIVVQLEGSLEGILYLENKEIPTPLNMETLNTLELILSQAAIIFKNTSLYENLKRNDESLNKAQELLHVGSWGFNPLDSKITWSAETYRIFELEPFSIDIDYDTFTSYLHPDDIDYINEEVSKALNHSSKYDVKHRIITAKGNVKFVQQRSELFEEDGLQKMSGTIQDITSLKQNQDQISRLTQAIEQSPVCVVMTNISGKIEYVNNQYVKTLEYTKDELIGSNTSIVSSNKHVEKFYEELWTKILTNKETWNGLIIDKTKYGKFIDFDSTIFPIFDDKRNIISFVAVQNDVTQRNIQDKLFLMQTRQAQMGEMLSMIAHQWRQPLSIISAIVAKEEVSIALDKFNVDNLTDSFHDMTKQIQYLSNTITDFRDFFKPNKNSSDTSSKKMVEKALNIISPSLIVKGIETKTEYKNDTSYKTFENEVVQVIINILKNAQDAFSEKNIDEKYILINTDSDDLYSYIYIEDNAGGIDDSIIDTLFLPYTTTKSDYNGTGLGLYMCKTIIDEHCKGNISVQNTKLGARFSIKIAINN